MVEILISLIVSAPPHIPPQELALPLAMTMEATILVEHDPSDSSQPTPPAAHIHCN